MTSKEVLLSTCDRCTKEVTTPLHGKKRRNRGEIILPPGWLHVSGNTATSLVFEMDLCDECKVFVLEAAGRGVSAARRSPTTSTTRHVSQKGGDETSESAKHSGKKKLGDRKAADDDSTAYDSGHTPEPSELTVELAPAEKN